MAVFSNIIGTKNDLPYWTRSHKWSSDMQKDFLVQADARLTSNMKWSEDNIHRSYLQYVKQLN